MTNSRPFVTIAIQCEFFQRRLCWMLSTLLREPVVVDIAYMPHNGQPQTEAVIAEFRDLGLDIRSTVFDDYKRFQYRGLTRNVQVANCDTDYICFADTDMTYIAGYWSRLKCEVDASYGGMYIAGRMSQNTADPAEALVAARADRFFINHAYALAAGLPLVRRSNVGAGYFQLLRTDLCGGYYVDPLRNRDHGWTDTYSKCRSDQQFRHRIGKKQRLPRWFTETAVHLNHARDNEHGQHLETQR